MRDDVVVECGDIGHMTVYAYDNGMRVLEELPQTASRDEIQAAQMRVADAILDRQRKRVLPQHQMCECGRPRADEHDLARWRKEAVLETPEPEWSRMLCWTKPEFRCNMRKVER